MTGDLDHAGGRHDDPGQHLEQRALAGAVRSDDGQRLALHDLEGDLPQRPERRLTAPRPEEVGERRAHLRLAREAQVVADAEVAGVDGDGALAVLFVDVLDGHQRTFAKAGSTRLKYQVAKTRSRMETPDRISSEVQFGLVPS